MTGHSPQCTPAAESRKTPSHIFIVSQENAQRYLYLPSIRCLAQGEVPPFSRPSPADTHKKYFLLKRIAKLKVYTNCKLSQIYHVLCNLIIRTMRISLILEVPPEFPDFPAFPGQYCTKEGSGIGGVCGFKLLELM